LISALAEFWNGFPRGAFPAWVDLANGRIAPFKASAGMTAIAQLVWAQRAGTPEPAWPMLSQSQDYYSSVLTLLARVAWQEIAGQQSREAHPI
jgi:hypothetical protein